MPHTKSAEKSLRQDAKRRLRNRYTKKQIKLQIRAFLAAVESGNVEEARAEYNLASRKLDKAGARHVIHRNAAARQKSRLSSKLAAMSPKPTQ